MEDEDDLMFEDWKEIWEPYLNQKTVQAIRPQEHQIYTVRRYVPDYHIPDISRPLSTRSNAREIDQCRLHQKYRGQPCKNYCYRNTKDEYCSDHNNYCATRNKQYQDLCHPIWKDKCNPNLDLETNEEIRLRALHCVEFRRRYMNDCVPIKRQDAGHRGAISKLDKVAKNCEKIEQTIPEYLEDDYIDRFLYRTRYQPNRLKITKL